MQAGHETKHGSQVVVASVVTMTKDLCTWCCYIVASCYGVCIVCTVCWMFLSNPKKWNGWR